jgi:hypothetical protein
MAIGLGRKKDKPHHVDLGKKGGFTIHHPGALHEALGLSEDTKIPASRLRSKAGDSSHVKHMKASALGFKAMKH